MGTTSHLLQVTSLPSSSHDSISWTIQLTLNGNMTQPELPFRIPVDVQEEAEVFWYLENYTKSPFDADRAAKAVRLMKKYTASLVEQLHLEDVISGLKVQDGDEDQSILMLDVVEMREDSKGIHSSPSIQRILWELLEQPSLWSTKVLVRRRLALPNTTSTPRNGHLRLWKPFNSPSESHYSLNLLLVIARDLDPNKPEVDPTISLKPLIALQDELREAVGVKPRLSLEIVRPGTYAALRKHLQIATMRHGKGYHHLVHFDMHGVLRTRSTDKNNASSSTQPLTAGLSFAPKTHGSPMDFIPARKVAILLRDHGIRLVVSNACQSANARTAGTDANLARVFIEEGISNVAAMQADVMSGSATSFSANFYRGFLQRGLSFSEAVHASREELRKDGIRSARFGLEVALEDWMVPVTYLCGADARIMPPEMTPSEDFKVPASILPSFFSSLAGFTTTPPAASIDLIGRGRDALNIEKDLIESKILIVTGQAGVGKTALLRHLAGVWRATKFAERVIYVDFAQPPFLVTVSEAIERAKSGGGPMTSFAGRVSGSLWGWWTQDKTVTAEDMAQFVEDCHEHSSVLIFDSLDLALSALSPRVRSGSLNDDRRAELSALVDRLVNSTLKQGQKKPMVILLGRAGGLEYWNNRFETISSRVFKLMPLDLPSAVSLGGRILQQAGVKTSSWNIKEMEILYRLVNLLSRNPLALEVVLPHVVTEKSLANFYETIHFHLLASSDIWKCKPSTPGADRILYDIDTFFMRASYQMRNVLRSFSLFWIEGPALPVCHTVLAKVFSPETDEDKFWDVLETHLLLYAALGAWDLEAATKGIVEIHPLFSIYLRSKLFGYLPFEKKLDFPTLITNFGRMLDESHKSLSLQLVGGSLDFALLCNVHKRSLANIVTCLKCCLANRTAEEWPMQTVYVFIDSSRFAFRDSVPDHLFFLQYLEPALRYYVLQFGGPLKCLAPENLPFALKLSNHLTTMYLLDAGFVPDKAARQAQYSLELIKASEEKHPPLSYPPDMFEKQMAFRLKATISLSQRNFAEAEKFWDLQTELETFILGPNGYPSTVTAGMATIKKQFGDTAAVANAMSVITSNADTATTTFLPALAELRQKAWSEIVKSMKSAGPDEDLRHSMRPYVQHFTDQISGATSGVMSRVVDVSKDVGYDVGYVQEEYDPQSWQSDLDEALDQGDSARVLRIQQKLLTEDLQSGNFASARIHVEMLQQHLETIPNPPQRPVYWISLVKTMLEAVKGMSDAERLQVADAIRMFNADEGFASILKDIAENIESRAGINGTSVI